MGLVRTLLWGDEDEVEQAFDNPSFKDSETHDANWNEPEEVVDFQDIDSAALLPITSSYDPEQSIRRTLEREAAEVRERDELNVRVGKLALGLESLLRLLMDKGVITDLDLRRMEQKVDLEDVRPMANIIPASLPSPVTARNAKLAFPPANAFANFAATASHPNDFDLASLAERHAFHSVARIPLL